MSNFTLSDYKIQSYLLANAEKLLKDSARNSLSFAQYVKKLKDTDPNQLVANKLNPASSVDLISSLPQEVLNNLVLEVKVFKVFLGTGENNREIEVELPHNQQVMANYDALQPNQNIGDPGVQIENIEIVRLGGNPAEIDSNIEVRISLFATSIGAYFVKHRPANIADLVADNTIPEDIRRQIAQNVSWIDLIKMNLETGGETDPEEAYAKSQGILTKAALQKGIFQDGLAYNAEQQRIKLQIGYSVEDLRKKLENVGFIPESVRGMSPTDQTLQAKTDEAYRAIEQQIQQQTEVYYLNLVQNDIGFNSEDGSVTIQINYIASTGTNIIDRKNDLLFEPYLYEKALQLDDSMCELQENLDNDEEVRVLVDPFATGDDKKKDYTTAEEKKAGLTEIDKIKRRLEVIQANKLINGLYSTSLYGKDKFKQKIEQGNWYNRYTRVNILFAPKEDFKGKIVGRISEDSKCRNLGSFYKYSLSFSGKKADKARSGIRASQRAAQVSGYQETEIEALFDDNFGSQISGDEVNIEFTFLGDIIETAFEVLASNNRFAEGTDYETFPNLFEQDSKYINKVRRDADSNSRNDQEMSDWSSEDLELYVTPFYQNDGKDDPRLPELYKQYGELLLSNITYKSPADVNTEITLKLADLPISMIEFKKWFIRNISGVRRRHFFVKNYLESLVNWVSKLVGDAVASDDTKTTDLEPPELLINRYFLKVPRYDFLARSVHGGNVDDELDNEIAIDSVKSYVEDNASDYALNSKVLTLLGQTPTKKAANRVFTEAADRDLGIPWIRFGKSRSGMLNDINFQREDMPGLREARLFEGKDMYGLSILREKYNSTLRFYGNNFFKPGVMFYVEPDQLNIYNLGITSDITSPARALGIGGYHLTIRVTHEITLTDSRWYTSVEGQWQTFGDEESETESDDEDKKCKSSIVARNEEAWDLSSSVMRTELKQRRERKSNRRGVRRHLGLDED